MSTLPEMIEAKVREVSDLIWNQSGKHTHNQLDGILRAVLLDTYIQAKQEGMKATAIELGPTSPVAVMLREAREEGRSEGAGDKNEEYWRGHDDGRKEAIEMSHESWIEEGKAQEQDWCLKILTEEIATAHHEGTPSARLTSAYNQIASSPQLKAA